MNFMNVVQDLMKPAEQTKKCGTKNTDLSDAFHSQLAEFMKEGNSSISIKHVEVTGRANSAEGIMPDYESLSELTERINYLLDLLFVRNGIPKDPPVEIEYTYTRTEITVTGNRDDIGRIEELVNEDSELSELIRSAVTLASHLINMAESLRFQKEYRDNSDSDSVINDYAYLFNEERHFQHASIRYNGSTEILSDGKNYSL